MKFNIYGCGGTGVQQAVRFVGMGEDLGIEVNVIGMLASVEDIPNVEGFTRENVFLVPEIEGSGQVREENYEAMREFMPQAMASFPPADVNIVMFSGFGGSGSVLGPLIAEHCIKNDHQVVNIVSLGNFSLTAAKNTVDTLHSLEGIAQANEDVVVPIHPLAPSNDETKRNQKAGEIVDLLLMLYSGQHQALDVNDLKYWLQHGRHSEMTGRCNVLSVVPGATDLSAIKDPISVISLMKDESVKVSQLSIPYHTKGYGLKVPDLNVMHYCLSEAMADDVLAEAAAEEKRLQNIHDSRARKKVVTERSDASGMVVGRRR